MFNGWSRYMHSFLMCISSPFQPQSLIAADIQIKTALPSAASRLPGQSHNILDAIYRAAGSRRAAHVNRVETICSQGSVNPLFCSTVDNDVEIQLIVYLLLILTRSNQPGYGRWVN